MALNIVKDEPALTAAPPTTGGSAPPFALPPAPSSKRSGRRAKRKAEEAARAEAPPQSAKCAKRRRAKERDRAATTASPSSESIMEAFFPVAAPARGTMTAGRDNYIRPYAAPDTADNGRLSGHSGRPGAETRHTMQGFLGGLGMGFAPPRDHGGMSDLEPRPSAPRANRIDTNHGSIGYHFRSRSPIPHGGYGHGMRESHTDTSWRRMSNADGNDFEARQRPPSLLLQQAARDVAHLNLGVPAVDRLVQLSLATASARGSLVSDTIDSASAPQINYAICHNQQSWAAGASGLRDGSSSSSLQGPFDHGNRWNEEGRGFE